MFCYQSGRVSADIQEIWKQIRILQRRAPDDTSWGCEEIWTKLTLWLPSWTWLKHLFVTVPTIIAMCVLAYLLQLVML